jgi:hypothetical protein
LKRYANINITMYIYILYYVNLICIYIYIYYIQNII